MTALQLAPRALAQPTPPPAGRAVTPSGTATTPDRVPVAQRNRSLGRGWSTSTDFVWTLAGDSTGLHLLRATARSGYRWQTVATLSEPGFDTDRWIGNGCLTGSGRRVVIVYAPRSFENVEALTQRGAFVAVVDLGSGRVRKLSVTASLAYFDPGCGTDETAVLTQEAGSAQTRLVRISATSARTVSATLAAGQVTSAVPSRSAIVAARGPAVVSIGRDGRVARMATTRTVPYHLVTDGGGVVYLDGRGADVRVRRTAAGTTRTLASGTSGTIGLQRGLHSRVQLTGQVRTMTRLPASVSRVDAPASATMSVQGQLAVTAVDQHDPRTVDPDVARSLRVSAISVRTKAVLSFTVRPDPVGSDTARRASPALAAGGAGGSSDPRRRAAGSATNPVEADRTCAVPRNDVSAQAYQPTPRQVEWAADQAVVGNLKVSRPANWRQAGLPAYTPQGLFPPRTLAGGGRVNVQVLLGILAQESNLWQASNHALSGEYGNPLVGNFYGRALYDKDQTNDWVITWSNADCGYGVAQVTDGMRLGDTKWSSTQQRAIALDYAANLSAGLQILQDKWNQTYSAGLRANGGNPAYVESWFFAAWAYNTGFYPDKKDGSPWGVGWLNNPVNPRYPADRHAFLDLGYDDARVPGQWPYPEKVMGWAANAIATVDGPGFRPAWWYSTEQRTAVKPPVTQFCDASNSCYPGQTNQPTDPNVSGEKPGPCAHKNSAGQYDLLCYYHQPSVWKGNCALDCGNELLRFDTSYPEQPDGTHFPPNCSTAGLPSGALIIDDVADTVTAPRSGCKRGYTSAGSFGLSFGSDGTGTYPGKIDFHQVGGGFNGHFWFAHTRSSATDPGRKLMVTGTWTLNKSLQQWARVLIHLPDHGAQTREAFYTVDLGNGTTRRRNILQRTQRNGWVSIGSFGFAGVPKVSLSSVTADGDGSEDVAWDAVAIQPLAAKPRNRVVALGDSYSSGEGASAADGSDYYAESDVDSSGGYWRDGCHRSRYAWPRKGVLKDSTTSIGARADAFDPTLDLALLACSGAETQHLLPGTGKIGNAFNKFGSTRFGELPQVDRGFLDADTTLVTLSIGGNDARFGDVVSECIVFAGVLDCPNTKIDGDNDVLKVAEPNRIKGPVRESINTALGYVHSLAPNAKIVLMGYPILVEPAGVLEDTQSCVPGLSSAEVTWINEMTDLMAQQMALAATQSRANGVPVTFSDPRSAFRGQGVCGSPETVNGLVVSKTPGDDPNALKPSQQSFHPKIGGTTNYAASLNATLRSLGL